MGRGALVFAELAQPYWGQAGIVGAASRGVRGRPVFVVDSSVLSACCGRLTGARMKAPR